MDNCKCCDEQEFSKCTCEVEPAFPKPGLHKKKTIKTPYVKKREIEPPSEKHCRRCNKTTEKECYRHSESRIVKFLGTGGIMGDKIPPRMSAWLCSKCDLIMSKTPPKDSSYDVIKDHALEWLILIVKSHNM